MVGAMEQVKLKHTFLEAEGSRPAMSLIKQTKRRQPQLMTMKKGLVALKILHNFYCYQYIK